MRFTDGHATTPLCAPSRSSVFSGRYAHNHGVRNNGASRSLDRHTTLQRYLKQAGYRTGLFGKYLNSWDLAEAPPHFEEFALLRPSYVDGTFNVDGTVRTVPGHTTTVVKNRAPAFIDKSRTDDRPWFAYVTPYASHGSNTPEPECAGTDVPAWDGRPSVPEADRGDKPAYVRDATRTLADGRLTRAEQLRTPRSVDDAVGAFRDKPAAPGRLDDTLVVYIGDNGFNWAGHGLGGKGVPYRPAHEVPFHLSWPGGGPGGGGRSDRGEHRHRADRARRGRDRAGHAARRTLAARRVLPRPPADRVVEAGHGHGGAEHLVLVRGRGPPVHGVPRAPHGRLGRRQRDGPGRVPRVLRPGRGPLPAEQRPPPGHARAGEGARDPRPCALRVRVTSGTVPGARRPAGGRRR
ncbi:sulfatase-like hydrolase/transferase [Streptomyces sp. NPDC057217]|uniref:sulfatase-like hydrolase/transferase n=1 Tax=Streptomyces sp. NPDC057217 TaxID=3346054 RepID=UPI00362D902C